MQVGSEAREVLVVSGDGSEGREVAAAIETTLESVSVVAVTDPEEAAGTQEGAGVDGVVVAVDASAEAAAIETRSAGDAPVVACLAEDGHDARVDALDAGAEVVAPAGDDGYRVLCNRLELVLSAESARRAARETQQRYRRLLEASPAAIVIYDADGTVLYANPAAADLCGADDPHDVVGRPVFEFVAEEDHDAVADRFERVIERREAVEATELTIEGVDGEVRYAETAGNPVTVDGEPGGQAVMTDVTALKERERRLRTERDRFTALFESLPEPAVHVRYDGTHPMVQTVNTAFEEVFGFDEETAAGESLNDLVVPEGQEGEARALDRETLADGHIERELQRLSVDGTREFLFRARKMETAEGTAEGVGIYVDITDHKQRQEALEHKNERLEAFASIVSHDLQSPLSVAKGNLFLAREEDDPEYLDRVDDALDRMERIIEDLLKLARSGAEGVDPQPVDGGRLVTEAWSEIPGNEGTLENEFDATIEADPGQLRELLANLLRNAVEHASATPGQGEEVAENGSTGEGATADDAAVGDDVRVRVGVIRERPGSDEGRDPAGNAGGEQPTLNGFYVADDGPGILEDERDSVFEPGYTTHDEGSGFGLVVVREIADAHGWDVSVTEGAEGGARFEFRGVDPA
jgi:PAS domain S-box-containing protein